MIVREVTRVIVINHRVTRDSWIGTVCIGWLRRLSLVKSSRQPRALSGNVRIYNRSWWNWIEQSLLSL